MECDVSMSGDLYDIEGLMSLLFISLEHQLIHSILSSLCSLSITRSLSRAPHPREARLFQASTATGSFKVEEVANYDQSDLNTGNTQHVITAHNMT